MLGCVCRVRSGGGWRAGVGSCDFARLRKGFVLEAPGVVTAGFGGSDGGSCTGEGRGSDCKRRLKASNGSTSTSTTSLELRRESFVVLSVGGFVVFGMASSG